MIEIEALNDFSYNKTHYAEIRRSQIEAVNHFSNNKNFDIRYSVFNIHNSAQLISGMHI